MRQTSAAWAPITGPNGSNPLRGILDDLLDPAAFRLPGAPELVVAATSVRTGKARLFHDAEITVDVLLALVCLPQLFPSVTIDGESYWDGGYASNPPLWPLIEAGVPPDVLIVRSTPLERPGRPGSAAAIQQRVNEITFGAALRSELRSPALAQRLLVGVPDVPPELARLRDARMHMIGAETEFQALRGGSSQDPSWGFLSGMHDLGTQVMERWLDTNLPLVGHRSTAELERFADPQATGGRRRHAA